MSSYALQYPPLIFRMFLVPSCTIYTKCKNIHIKLRITFFFLCSYDQLLIWIFYYFTRFFLLLRTLFANMWLYQTINLTYHNIESLVSLEVNWSLPSTVIVGSNMSTKPRAVIAQSNKNYPIRTCPKHMWAFSSILSKCH